MPSRSSGWGHISRCPESFIKVFSVGPDGGVHPSHSISLPAASVPRRKEEIPAGLAVSPDGRKLFVCGNLSNRLLEIDPETGLVFRAVVAGVRRGAPVEQIAHARLIGIACRDEQIKVDAELLLRRHIEAEGDDQGQGETERSRLHVVSRAAARGCE